MNNTIRAKFIKTGEVPNSILFSGFLVLFLFSFINTRAKNDSIEVRRELLRSIGVSQLNSIDLETQKRAKATSYFRQQAAKQVFKENSACIQYLDGGRRERVWFASSRPDEYYGKDNKTKFYQQIYYSDRMVGDGKMPSEGWCRPKRFEFKGSNPLFSDFYEMFNRSNKGACAVSNDLLVFSCDQLKGNGPTQNKNLWSVEVSENSVAGVPKPIEELCSRDTWESQPCISSDGKHMFFVSNRLVEENGIRIDTNKMGNNTNIFYSFFNGKNWSSPQIVFELYSESNEITPNLNRKGDCLYFSTDRNGTYDIYEKSVRLHKQGGYSFTSEPSKPISTPLMVRGKNKYFSPAINDSGNQTYPFCYENKLNSVCTRALYWSCDNLTPNSDNDIFACSMPYRIQYNLHLVDRTASVGFSEILEPVLSIEGFEVSTLVKKSSVTVDLLSGIPYTVKGGSYATEQSRRCISNGIPRSVFIGYKPSDNTNERQQSQLVRGQELGSVMGCGDTIVQFVSITNDVVVHDTIFVEKAWRPYSLAQAVVQLPVLNRSIAYFQSGYWEVNSYENLKRDLQLLHQGYVFEEGEDLYHPKGRINRKRSDYLREGASRLYPILKKDGYKYSIANARWIELHPNNYYWGDRPEFPYDHYKRMEGREKRIRQYVDYAKKVDANLQELSSTIAHDFLPLLDQYKEHKPKLLIEIKAISDEREVLRGWYIGDTVQYRSSTFDVEKQKFSTNLVQVFPPKVDDENKTITNVFPCTMNRKKGRGNGTELSAYGDDSNSNLSRLRAWFGYKALFDELKNEKLFAKNLEAKQIALPDNTIDYEEASIVLISHGEGAHSSNQLSPFPKANNPNGKGYYSYDSGRRIEVFVHVVVDHEIVLDTVSDKLTME